MEFPTAAWVSLIGLCCWVFPWLGNCQPNSREQFFSGSYERSPGMEDAHKNPRSIDKFSALLICIGAFCAILMLYQGFHLLNSGYEGLTNADPSTIARTSVKARGRGGIFILLINYFPQFCISTSIYTLFTGRRFVKDCLKVLIGS